MNSTNLEWSLEWILEILHCRFAALFDSVVHFLFPTWEYTAGTFQCLEVWKKFFVLASLSNALKLFFLLLLVEF